MKKGRMFPWRGWFFKRLVRKSEGKPSFALLKDGSEIQIAYKKISAGIELIDYLRRYSFIR